ncbi:hypothetical protein F5882DRAFT_92499 [Hyaloscypha sp. PMI_1271]|nr:hypothetical protein F5882DRAFT_92499 [Hyaloscypha sp. PMI_1271]
MGPQPTGSRSLGGYDRWGPYDVSCPKKNTGPRYPPSLFGEPKALPGGWRGSSASAQAYNAAGMEHGYGYGYGQTLANNERGNEPTDPTGSSQSNGGNGLGGRQPGGSGNPGNGRAESQESGSTGAAGNAFNVTNSDPPDDPPSLGGPGGTMFDGNSSRHETTGTSTGKAKGATSPISTEISVRAREGGDHNVIMVLDTGSPESWITKDCLERLGATEDIRRCVETPVPRFQDWYGTETFDAESEIELSLQVVLPNSETIALTKTRFFVFQTRQDYHILFGSKLIVNLDPGKLGSIRSIVTCLDELVSDPERGELRRAARIRSQEESVAARHRRWAVGALDRCAKYEYLEKTNGHFRKPNGTWVVDISYGGWKWCPHHAG